MVSGAEGESTPANQPSAGTVEPYLKRLYLESRHTIFRILLGETLPPKTPFPADQARTDEIMRRIESLTANDEHLSKCRETLGGYFPGRLAVLLNLAGRDDELFPLDRLRQSILNHVRRHEANLAGQSLDAEDQRAIDELKASSRLQQQLAYLVSYTPGKWLLEQEIPVILESRRRRLGKAAEPEASQTPAGRDGHSQRGDSYLWSRDIGRLSGLCLSGGGIRSATFNLGILQGLASRNLLRRFDYCSSVSGGGYIHQWLAAWIKREEELSSCGTSSPGRGSPGLDTVCRRLIPQPEPGCSPVPAEPIRWLRRYSNYLTPKTGLLSADLWVTVAIWVRNTALNQIVLISGLLWLLMAPHIFLVRRLTSHLVPLTQQQAELQGSPELGYAVLTILILAAVIWSSARVVRRLAEGLLAARRKDARHPRLTEGELFWDVILPSHVLAIVISSFGFWFALPGVSASRQLLGLAVLSLAALTALNVTVTWAGGAPATRLAAGRRFGTRERAGYAAVAVLAALVGTGGIVMARNAFVTASPVRTGLRAANAGRVLRPPVHAEIQPQAGNHPQSSYVRREERRHPRTSCDEPDFRWRAVVVFGPLVVMIIPFISVVVNCGLIGRDFEDWVLEWLARVRAWITLYGFLWALVVGIALFGHYLLELAAMKHGWIKWPVIGSWLMTTAASVLAGRSAKTGGENSSVGAGLRILVAVGPPVYVVGLLLMLAWVVDESICVLQTGSGDMPDWIRYLIFCGMAILPLAVFLLFGWRVDVNQFSMHTYYRNRLARCYLGASNSARDPDPLTGFDSADVEKLRLSYFQPRCGYPGPLPVFCASLNISVGEDLAWQERKAASFAFSPVLSGYYIPWTGLRYQGELSYNGFVPTERFAYSNGGVDLSTAAAISGAAISPNWGYHTSPPMAFLLTMFNVRLGWWMENPRRSWLAFDPGGDPPPGRARFPRPRFAPAQLFQELIGQVGDDRKFVYLTDGGHFDNMGLYELVRRRCYEIVICDAEEDMGPVFEGIGMAIRKCRIDFGAEIELDLQKLACDAETGMSKVHWITGTIRYPETGDARPGNILYIKSSIIGNEPGDVLNYRLRDTAFPQDTTADQWFTESQFESYRRLGQQVIDECSFLAGLKG